MKHLKILIALIFLTVSASAQFPGTDSLRNFNNRFITNDAKAAFTNLRLHNLIAGCIDWIDSARLGIGGFIGVDTIWAQTDSTIIYRKQGVFHVVAVKGAGRGQNIANAALTANGDYIQQWNHKKLFFNGASFYAFELTENDLNGSGYKVSSSIESFPYWNFSVPLNFGTALRNSANTQDSLLRGFHVENSTTEIYNKDFNNTNFSNVGVKPDTVEMNVARGTNIKSKIFIDTSRIILSSDSIQLTALQKTIADSVLAIGPYNSTLKANTLYKVSKEVLFNANHGVFKDADSVKLGDSIHNHFNLIHYTNQKRYNPPTQQSGLVLSNGLQMDTTIFAFPIFDTTSAANGYDKPLLAVGRYFNDDDSIYRAYGGSIQAVTRYAYDSNRTAFYGDTSIGMPISTGGVNAVQQVFPPKSIHWNTTPFGGSGSVYTGDLGIGGINSYRIYTGSGLNGYPITAMRLGIDLARSNNNVKREIYGNGLSTLLLDYRSYQANISSGTTEWGSYFSSLTGLDIFGNLYRHTEAPSKAKVLAISKIDTVRAIRIRPINTATSEVKNGYSIWSEGSMDTMYHAGYVGIANSGPHANLDVFGTAHVGPFTNFRQTFNGGAPASLYVTQAGNNWGLAVARATNNNGVPHITIFKNWAADFSTLGVMQEGNFMGDINWQAVAGDGATIPQAITLAAFAEKVSSTKISAALSVNTIDTFGVNAYRFSTNSDGHTWIGRTGAITNTYQLYVSGDSVRISTLGSSSNTIVGANNNGVLRPVKFGAGLSLNALGDTLNTTSDLTSGPVKTNIHVVNDADYTLGANDYFVVYKTMTAGRTITMPSAASSTNRMVIIKNGGDGAFNITLSVNYRENATTTGNTIATTQSIGLISDGTDWWVAWIQ